MTALSERYNFNDEAVFLPDRMKRVGYDADTERYMFREGNDLWEGEPGSYYGGKMRWAGKVSCESPPQQGQHVTHTSYDLDSELPAYTADAPPRNSYESNGFKKLTEKTVAVVHAVRRMSTKRRSTKLADRKIDDQTSVGDQHQPFNDKQKETKQSSSDP
ncbi:hypothetical protein Clacol_002939 [Clathrus columnatus]|uniref:Uncharacterized protein n=1 Tax=Clathrus columnatus TaxID=1419009 RepID=A0AAV5A6X9_9AGAM|nr:hypothetical protein Clacol_002939 [Clathrus columnatus]